jgi:hypothetical protein
VKAKSFAGRAAEGVSAGGRRIRGECVLRVGGGLEGLILAGARGASGGSRSTARLVDGHVLIVGVRCAAARGLRARATRALAALVVVGVSWCLVSIGCW